MDHYHHLSTRERESILFMRGEGLFKCESLHEK